MDEEILDAIEKEVEIQAPIERVWRALTNHEEFGAWFRVKLEEPFVAGRESAGFVTWPGYEHLRWVAVVQKIEEPCYFSFTWHPYGIDKSVDYSSEEPTLVEFRLSETEGGTLLKVRESGFSKVPASRRAEAFRMNANGWAQQMGNIAEYVAQHS
jgi:uncharacterized protein YndB with AHSA1/START domain